MRAIGDLASFMLSSQFQARLLRIADSSAQEATTGVAQDNARHLGSSTMGFSLLERKTQLLEQHQKGIAEAAVIAGATQSVLGKIQDQLGELATGLSLAGQLNNATELKALSDTAAMTLMDTVNALNSEIVGRHLFSGTASRTSPLPAGASFLDMLRSDVAGAATPGDLVSAVDEWFNAPSNPFETLAYSGSDTGFTHLPIGPGETVTFGLRADGDTVREVLKALGIAALAADPSFGFNTDAQKTLLEQGRLGVLKVDRALTEERAGLGLIEARIEAARVATDIELDETALDRLSLVGVDEFKAASEFEAAQQQLEVFYRVAARQSRVSLAEYLR
jgi:flagellar hook-associated protein 3 FlgL